MERGKERVREGGHQGRKSEGGGLGGREGEGETVTNG
jgi:hypothetical protein